MSRANPPVDLTPELWVGYTHLRHASAFKRMLTFILKNSLRRCCLVPLTHPTTPRMRKPSGPLEEHHRRANTTHHRRDSTADMASSLPRRVDIPAAATTSHHHQAVMGNHHSKAATVVLRQALPRAGRATLHRADTAHLHPVAVTRQTRTVCQLLFR